MIFITFSVLLLKLRHDRIVFLKINLGVSLIGKKGKTYTLRRKKEREREFTLGF